MRWILLDVTLALLALGLLAVLLLRLWRQVKTLSRLVGTAGERVATATDALAQAQGAGPLGAGARPAGAPPAGAPPAGAAVSASPAGQVQDRRPTGPAA